jgi:hypothetical protein
MMGRALTSIRDADNGQEVPGTLSRNQARCSGAADMLKRRLDQVRMAALTLSASGTVAAKLTATVLLSPGTLNPAATAPPAPARYPRGPRR